MNVLLFIVNVLSPVALLTGINLFIESRMCGRCLKKIGEKGIVEGTSGLEKIKRVKGNKKIGNRILIICLAMWIVLAWIGGTIMMKIA